jgi:hypothetical protein
MPPIPPPHWLEYFKAFAQPTAIIIVAILTYFFGYKNWKKQKEKEPEYLLKQASFTSKIEACKAAWGLLIYMSDKENDKTVIVKRDDGYYLRREQAIDYFKALPAVFYEQGHGLFLPQAVRDGLYGFRGQIYQVLDAERVKGNIESEMVKIEQNKIIEFVEATRKAISDVLKESINEV